MRQWFENNNEHKRPAGSSLPKKATYNFDAIQGRCRSAKEVFSQSDYDSTIKPFFHIVQARARDDAMAQEKERLRDAFRKDRNLDPDFPIEDRFLSDIDITQLCVKPNILLVREAINLAWDSLTDEQRDVYEKLAVDAIQTKAEQKTEKRRSRRKGKKSESEVDGDPPAAEQESQAAGEYHTYALTSYRGKLPLMSR